MSNRTTNYLIAGLSAFIGIGGTLAFNALYNKLDSTNDALAVHDDNQTCNSQNVIGSVVPITSQKVPSLPQKTISSNEKTVTLIPEDTSSLEKQLQQNLDSGLTKEAQQIINNYIDVYLINVAGNDSVNTVLTDSLVNKTLNPTYAVDSANVSGTNSGMSDFEKQLREIYNSSNDYSIINKRQ